jgi:hypothetical protein
MSNHYLDVAVGLSATFLTLSLLCSAMREAIASLFQTRAKVLLDGVLTLLHEPARKYRLRGIVPSIKRFCRTDKSFGLAKLGPDCLSAEVMSHPLITGLAQQGRMPSYIPSTIFARAFVATLTTKYGKTQTATVLLEKVGNEGLSRTLLALMGEQSDDVAALEAAVCTWYDTVMDRIGGWYKRRSQLVLFFLGLFFAGTMNIDAIALSQRLWSDEAAAAQLAQKTADNIASGRLAQPAPTLIEQPPLEQAVAARKKMQQVEALPIGWPSPRFVGMTSKNMGDYLVPLLFALMGWIITAFASSLGAPFWFDGIGWLLALRGSGAKPLEGAQVEIKPVALPSMAPIKPAG